MESRKRSASSRTTLLAGWLSILAGAFLVVSSVVLLAFHLVSLLPPVSVNPSTGPLPVGALLTLGVAAAACTLLVGGVMLLRGRSLGRWIVVGTSLTAVALSLVGLVHGPLSASEMGWLLVPATIAALALASPAGASGSPPPTTAEPC
ncbi:hypothetical protein H7J77_06680 [Mycolicibacillus parakoreensis]|uniref:Integral membrane protein n=1 Tax=Mycolicibacillus parakoreensis TaxID=1069221 RepID=A0ABY3U7F2_9MYCO|nr:hypothetical protein [Mycolicibacillus parakoreensis]MCV7315223.1 hypothetical protein [Mycolicibacillus parakoreensis]ULN53442.1 hypothetical protein MIU77_03605 [Mycolicibacillus parakoreensis]